MQIACWQSVTASSIILVFHLSTGQQKSTSDTPQNPDRLYIQNISFVFVVFS